MNNFNSQECFRSRLFLFVTANHRLLGWHKYNAYTVKTDRLKQPIPKGYNQ
jgi:hypothetical protein